VSRVYLDSSAVIKRVVPEAESPALIDALDVHHAQTDLLVSSSLAWIETARALRRLRPGRPSWVAREVEAALSGVAEHPITPEVLSLARRVGPDGLRSLDAIHLASAVLVDADLVLTYDDRLAAGCAEVGLVVRAPA
jgi:uncharacterized protein